MRDIICSSTLARALYETDFYPPFILPWWASHFNTHFRPQINSVCAGLGLGGYRSGRMGCSESVSAVFSTHCISPCEKSTLYSLPTIESLFLSMALHQLSLNDDEELEILSIFIWEQIVHSVVITNELIYHSSKNILWKIVRSNYFFKP